MAASNLMSAITTATRFATTESPRCSLTLRQAWRYLGMAVTVALLGGCGLISDRSDDYRNEKIGTPVKVPEWLSDENLRPSYPIREARAGGAVSQDEFVLPRPPDMTSEILDQNYVVEELNEQAWLLVNDVPGRVWPGVSAYMVDRGLGIDRDNPQVGLLQSNIADYSQRARKLLSVTDADGDQRTLLQAKVSPGVRRKTTEIQFRVREVPESPQSMLQWPSKSTTLAQEKKLLSDLGDFLKSREDSKSYSRAALNIPNTSKIHLLSGQNKDRRIEIELNYDRAWAEVNRALSEADVPVVDIDRSAGLLYVDYRTEDEREPGWFSWFSDPPKPEYTYLVSLDKQDEKLVLKTQVAPDFDGEDRSAKLLSELFEFLY